MALSLFVEFALKEAVSACLAVANGLKWQAFGHAEIFVHRVVLSLVVEFALKEAASVCLAVATGMKWQVAKRIEGRLDRSRTISGSVQ